MFAKQLATDILSIKKICSFVISSKKAEYLSEIRSILTRSELATKLIVDKTKIELLGIFVLTVRNSDKEYKLNEDEKIQLLVIVSMVLSYSKLDHNELLLFFNLFGSLIQEVYRLETSTLKDTSEELMWQVLNCVKLLFETVSDELCFILYTKENAMRLCKIIYVITEVVKHKSRKLKAEAIRCLMSMFRFNLIDNSGNFVCYMYMDQILADCFSYFLPGIALALVGVINEGSRVGEIILELTIEAMGKIMTILLKDYDQKNSSLQDAKLVVVNCLKSLTESQQKTSTDKKEDFLKMQRTRKWFQNSDKHLVPIFEKFNYLANHLSSSVRLKLAEMCISLIKHCFKNIPRSAHPLIEILVILSDNENEKITVLIEELLDTPILGDQIKLIVSEDFYKTFSRIPTIFNGVDSVQQVNILKLTSMSLKLVGSKMKCNEAFREFQHTLLYLCEMEIGTSNIIEVVSQNDFDKGHHVPPDLWKGFKYMKEESVRCQFSGLCRVIYEINLFPVLSDYLINIIAFGEEKTEAFYFMNQLLKGINEGKLISEEGAIIHLIMSTFEIYIDNWDIPLEITPDDDECLTLKMLKINVLQAALMCEGVGLMANHAKGEEHLRPFLFNSMYKVLIRAASRHYIIRLAATKALEDMAEGLGFSSVTQMLNDNMDFFLFYVERGLKKNTQSNEEVFDVMKMVMKYGDVSVLERFSDWMNDILIQSFDKYKQNRIDSYLAVFREFLRRMLKWYNVNIYKRRAFQNYDEKQKAKVIKFKIQGVQGESEITDFSDGIMGRKSALEMYKEDLAMKAEKVNDEFVEPKDEPYQKPTPPKPIRITVEILKRSLNFLPSKDTDRKLLVLEILRNGLYIIQEYEDELLPIVHLIWSPLVDRFKDIDSPVILNFSFQLLATMGNVSNDFIRNRMSKDVLPSILSTLSTLSKRNNKETSIYSLDYKVQLIILQKMFNIVYDIELLKEDIDAILRIVVLYTNINQPKGLRIAAYNFLTSLTDYNSTFHDQFMDLLYEDIKNEEN